MAVYTDKKLNHNRLDFTQAENKEMSANQHNQTADQDNIKAEVDRCEDPAFKAKRIHRPSKVIEIPVVNENEI